MRIKRRRRRYGRKKNKIDKKTIQLCFFFAGLAAVILLGIGTAWCYGMKISITDEAMSPEISKGDVVSLNRISYKLGKPKRNDVIAFKVGEGDTNLYFVRRIAALPGEKVKISNGSLYIDGEVSERASEGNIEEPGIAADEIALGEDEYFVLSDNINVGEDSRLGSIGIVSQSQIEGKVFLKRSPGFGIVN